MKTLDYNEFLKIDVLYLSFVFRKLINEHQVDLEELMTLEEFADLERIFTDNKEVETFELDYTRQAMHLLLVKAGIRTETAPHLLN